MSISSEVDTTPLGRRRHRLWPAALKREIVAASYAPGASVSMVARRYDVNANQVFLWRKLYRDDGRRAGPPVAPTLVPVMVTVGPSEGGTAEAAALIEIAVGGGYRIRVGRGFDADALRRVLDVLDRR